MSEQPPPVEDSDQDQRTGPEGAETDEATNPESADAGGEAGRIVVITPDGIGASGGEGDDPTSAIIDPAKIMRIGSMSKQLLKEVRGGPLDDAGRARLAAAHGRAIAELREALSPAMVEELGRVAVPFASAAAPSDAELRIAQAELVGWIEGLFNGIQAALVAKQMALQAHGPNQDPGPPASPVPPKGGAGGTAKGTGQYL